MTYTVKAGANQITYATVNGKRTPTVTYSYLVYKDGVYVKAFYGSTQATALAAANAYVASMQPAPTPTPTPTPTPDDGGGGGWVDDGTNWDTSGGLNGGGPVFYADPFGANYAESGVVGWDTPSWTYADAGWGTSVSFSYGIEDVFQALFAFDTQNDNGTGSELGW